MFLSIAKINSFIILSLAFFYPTIGLLNYFINIQSSIISITYRFFNLLIAVLVIINFKTQRLTVIRTAMLLFIIFWGLYLARIFIDIEHYNLRLTAYNSKSYYYYYALLITVIPMLSVFIMKYFDLDHLTRTLIRFFKLINLILLLIYIYRTAINHEVIYRFGLIRNEFQYLNTISTGETGGLLIILLIYNKLKSISDKLFLIIAITVLFVSGSRGPLLSTILVIVLIFLLNTKLIVKNYQDFVIKSILSISILILFFVVFDPTIIERLEHFNSDKSTIIRSSVLQNALIQYKSNPIFGSHFLVEESSNYTHNIIFDIFLATGIIGALTFLPIFYIFLRTLFKNKLQSAICAIGLFTFFQSLLSGSIFISYTFWILFALILTNRKFLTSNRNLPEIKSSQESNNNLIYENTSYRI